MFVRTNGADNLGSHARQKAYLHTQQVGIGGQRNARETDHEMTVDHGILQLGTMPFNLLRHWLAGDGRQRLREIIAIIEAHQAGKAKIGYAGTRLENIGRFVQRRADHQCCGRLAHDLDFRARRATDGQR